MTKQIMNYKFLPTIITMLSVVLVLSSCDDARLAKEIEGSWKGGITSKDADGTKTEETITFSFTYNCDSEKDGDFTETHKGISTFNDGDYDYEIHSISTINGEYQFIMGDLYLKYDVQSLKVDIDKVRMILSKDAGAFEQLGSLQLYMDGTLYEVKREIKKEAKKELYHDNFVQYQNWNESGAIITNVEINQDKMQFDTDDVGRITLTRTKYQQF